MRKDNLIFIFAYFIIVFGVAGCAKSGSSCSDCGPILLIGPIDIEASPFNNLVWTSRVLALMPGPNFMAVTAIDTSNNAIVVYDRYVTQFNRYSSLSQTLGVSFTDGTVWSEGLTFSNNGAESFIARYTKDGIKLNTFPINYFGQLQVSPSTGYGWVAQTLTDSANLVSYDLSGLTVTQVTLPYPVYGIRISPDSTILVAMNISGVTNCNFNDALIGVSQTGSVKGLYNLNYKVNAGFAVTSNGSIWIGDACNDKIIKLNPNLSTNSKLNLPFVPVMFAVLPDREEVVVVHDNTKVSFFDKNGNQINSVDLVPFQISYITSISESSTTGHIWVGTSYMNNSSGKPLFELDANGKIIASYSLP